jgi:hypothetical protein
MESTGEWDIATIVFVSIELVAYNIWVIKACKFYVTFFAKRRNS